MTLPVVQTADYSRDFPVIQLIRTQVFQVEQGVAPNLEFDGIDDQAIHLLAFLHNQPVGTLRIRDLGNAIAKIERLAVLQEFRGRGVAQQLMEAALDLLQGHGMQQVIVHAQEYIQGLYHKLGFEVEGDRFYEADIAHVKMHKLLTF
jgi:predicted GNAT family N-acyltransferase